MPIRLSVLRWLKDMVMIIGMVTENMVTEDIGMMEDDDRLTYVNPF